MVRSSTLAALASLPGVAGVAPDRIRVRVPDEPVTQVAALADGTTGCASTTAACPRREAINFQLLGGVWILQTFPAIIVGLYTRWFHRWAVLAGRAVGMVTSTLMAASQHFASVYPLKLGGQSLAGYAAFYALIANLVVVVVLTLDFNAVGATTGDDQTTVADYEPDGAVAAPLGASGLPS